MKNPARMFDVAVAHHQAGRFPDAEKTYREVLKIDKRNVDALRLLGGLYLQIHQPTLAEQYLGQAAMAHPNDAEILNNLGIALRNQGKLEKALSCYERALTLKPDHRQVLNNLALTLVELGRLEEASAQYERLLQIDPANFRAMNNYGIVLRELHRPFDACLIYQDALRLQPNYVEAHINLGNAYRDMDKLDEAQQQFEHALRLKPDSTDTMINMGSLMIDCGRWAEAITHYDNALHIKPDSAEAKWSKALALLALGKYREGWENFEAGLNNQDARGMASIKGAPWTGQPFPEKKLMIWSEQGFGDSLQFVRYAALCKSLAAGSGEVVVACPQPLARLFRNCPFIDKVVHSPDEDECDYHISMMSLPHVFGTVVETIPATAPYLFVDDATRKKWALRFSDAENSHKNNQLRTFKVGLVWAGNSRVHQRKAHLIDRRRSMHLSLLKPLLDIAPVQFYNLQMDAAADQIHELGLNDRITNLMPEVTDFLDTAAIIENLDLIIAVDTSVVHLAGGLGKPAWVLSRFDACWRWLRNQESNPWYPTARIFGQTEPGQWGSVTNRVQKALKAELTPGNTPVIFE